MYIETYTYTFIHIQTDIHTDTHTYVHTYIHAHMNTYIHKDLHTQTRTCLHVHTSTSTSTYICMCFYIHVYMYTCMHLLKPFIGLFVSTYVMCVHTRIPSTRKKKIVHRSPSSSRCGLNVRTAHHSISKHTVLGTEHACVFCHNGTRRERRYVLSQL